MLTHKYSGIGSYPAYQARVLREGVSDADGKISIWVSTNDVNGNPVGGKTAYFRVLDPADTAPYAINARANDNKDSAAGTLGGGGITPDPTNPRMVSAVSDASGLVKLILSTTPQYAGDNYRIEASYDPNFVCSGGCPQSGTLTAWKRVYVERDRMFRKGSDLTQDVSPGATEIRVANKRAFRRGDVVRIIHAPRLDGSSPAGQDTFYYEERRVTSTRGSFRRGSVFLDRPLSRSYEVDPSALALIGSTRLSDAVGVVNTDADLYDAGMDYVQGLFDAAFVEYVSFAENPSTVENKVPHVPFHAVLTPSNLYGFLAHKWFEHLASGRAPKANHQHLIGGSHTSDDGLLGETNIDMNTSVAPFSWVFQQAIEDAASGATTSAFAGVDAKVFNKETVAHELVHTFDVNPPWRTTGAHDSPTNRPAYDNSGECLMAYLPTSPTPRERADGKVALHSPAHPNSEYLRIREQAEPVPIVSQP